MAGISDFLLQCRRLVGDSPTSNFARAENMDNASIGNFINGTNTVFDLQRAPVAPGGFQTLIADGVTLSSPAGYTIDEDIAQITLTTPPTATLVAWYYFYLFEDDDWTTFVQGGIEQLSLSTGVPSYDIENIASGLMSALKKYACANWAYRMSSQTGLWYNQRLQEREENRNEISKKFLALAQAYGKAGDEERNSYYAGAGKQLQPSIHIKQWSPRPWAPMR